MPGECQDPIHLDRVCLHFPELKLCMAHGADPWWGVAIRLMIKYKNLHLMTSAYAPKYLPAELLHFMNTRGQDKILFASDHPVLSFQRCLKEAQELDAATRRARQVPLRQRRAAVLLAAQAALTWRRARRRARPRKQGSARKRLTPGAEARGPAPAESPLDPHGPELAALAARVEAAGGRVLGAYREPNAGHPLLFASLPRERVEPTPFQRDLSPTHVKRLAEKIRETGAFLDPIIAVAAEDGGFWTPNGRHRLAAAKVLGQRAITALVSPDPELAFRILALNTEKAHNLRDRSLEAIRMARALAARDAKAKESDFAAQLEAAELVTLGIVYEEEGRFAGGAYGPVLRKCDRFSDQPLAKTLRERAGYAARLREIDSEVKRIVKGLEARGFKSPYLRSYVVARINPVRFVKMKGGEAPKQPIGAVLTKMLGSAKKFELGSVRERDLALVAAVSSE